jgi:branched-chain amino acid transport system ATP-binding protein
MIQAQNISAKIGANQVLKDISLDVREGELFTVIGANGAGKTSLLRALSALLPIETGSISFNGRDIRGVPAHKLPGLGIIHIPQGRQIIPGLSVRDNLLIGAKNIGLERAVIDQALEEQWVRFPILKERQSIPGSALSGGEQQMLAVARGLMMRPKVLMLDEPSLGLSPLLTKEIFNIISRIRQETGTAVLVVEQNAAIALAHADYGYIMELGRIVAADSCAVLSQKADVREAYLGGHSTQGISGTSQRWKRRKTWR